MKQLCRSVTLIAALWGYGAACAQEYADLVGHVRTAHQADMASFFTESPSSTSHNHNSNGHLANSLSQAGSGKLSESGNSFVAVIYSQNQANPTKKAEPPEVMGSAPEARFGIAAPACTGMIVSFLDSSTAPAGGVLTSWYWDFGDGTPQVVTSDRVPCTHAYVAPGDYTVTLVVEMQDGQRSAEFRQVVPVQPNPVASFAASATELCLGDRFRFSDQSMAAGSYVSGWDWDFGDGVVTVSQPDQVKAYSGPGTYTVKMSVVSATGCRSDTAEQTVVVNDLPDADFTVSQPNCVGQDIMFMDASQAVSGNITRWSWDFGDGTSANRSANDAFTHKFADTGTFHIALRTETNKGCRSTPSIMHLEIHPFPVARFLMPENCLNDPYVQFTDASTNSDGSTGNLMRRWDFGDPAAGPGNPNTGTGSTPVHQFSAAGNYQVGLTVTTTMGCSAMVTQTFTVNGGSVHALFSPEKDTICGNEALAILNEATVDIGTLAKIDIFWDYTGNPTDRIRDEDPVTGKRYTHQYPEFSTPAQKIYRVRMIAYSGENCLQYYDRNIVVKATPRLALSAAGPDVCDNAAPFVPRFGRELSGISGTRTYAGDGISSTGLFDPSLIPPGDHLVRYTFAAENGCSAFSDYNVTILAAPRVSAGPDLSVTGGNQVVLRGTATGNNVVLTWSPATWLNNAETAMPTASPADNIIYTLTGVSSDGCRASDDVSVQVLKMPQIPNVFTPNGDGRNDRWEIPFLDRYSGCTVEIYNRYGQLLFRSVGYGSPWDGTFNSKPAPAGTYYYVINPGNGVKQISGFVDIIR